MNVAITVILCVVFAILGFCMGCFACMFKVNQLETEKKTLMEWLKVSRKTNEKLLKECDSLMLDLEAAVNGKSIINTEDETKTD